MAVLIRFEAEEDVAGLVAHLKALQFTVEQLPAAHGVARMVVSLENPLPYSADDLAGLFARCEELEKQAATFAVAPAVDPLTSADPVAPEVAEG